MTSPPKLPKIFKLTMQILLGLSATRNKKIQDLEEALADHRKILGRNISEINNKLKLLFKEYENL
jgi:hypothetical protein